MMPETTEPAGSAGVPGSLPGEGLVLTCEHGGKRIPAGYRGLFKGHQALLDSHRGFDPGALTMARALAEAFAAPLVVSTISRLLVDLNRSIGHPRLHFEVIRQASAEMRQEILRRYYEPYRARAAARVAQAITQRGRVIHISSHSFTPELDGKLRQADIGLLYDPARPGEVALAERWQASLKACAPDLTVRRNYPYAGKGDGLTAWFRRRFAPDIYIGIELEVNQKLGLGARRRWIALRQIIVESLRGALASHPGELSPAPVQPITIATPTATACPVLSRQPTGAPP